MKMQGDPSFLIVGLLWLILAKLNASEPYAWVDATLSMLNFVFFVWSWFDKSSVTTFTLEPGQSATIENRNKVK